MPVRRLAMMVQCAHVLKHIQAELDSRLNLAAYRQTVIHLECCPNCMNYLDSLKKVVYLYQHLFCSHPSMMAHKKLWTALRWELRSQFTLQKKK